MYNFMLSLTVNLALLCLCVLLVTVMIGLGCVVYIGIKEVINEWYLEEDE